MNILHVCWGTGTNNGAANIARLIMDEQRAAGNAPTLVSRPSWTQLRGADQIWCHCGWYWMFWLIAAYKRFFRSSTPTPSTGTYLHWVPECCYDPIRRRFHGWKKRLVGPIERWALRQADVLVATCDAEAGWIRDYLGRGEQVERGEGPKVVVSDIKRFFNLSPTSSASSPRSPRLNILYLGRPHPLKGVAYLEQAVEDINSQAEHGESVALREVSDHTGEALERDWEWCDVLCLPTMSDNFGLVIAEALSRGKRVLTTDGAPAWEMPAAGVKGEGEEWRRRLVYLRGYRNGNDATRVQLLHDALQRLRQ